LLSPLTAAIVAVSAAAWMYILVLRPMPESSVAILGFWTVMMMAMMLPSVLPAVLLFASLAPERRRFGMSSAPPAVFVVGYLLIWVLLGTPVAFLHRNRQIDFMQLAPAGVGTLLVLAGAYQLSSWKARCLHHCRSPIQFFMQHWHDGWFGAVKMGIYHGLYCVSCCWLLMAVLATVGMMSPGWMAVVAMVILFEKVARQGPRLGRITGAGLIACGVALVAGILPYGVLKGG
jgi:predicted metal-binding membrane protein